MINRKLLFQYSTFIFLGILYLLTMPIQFITGDSSVEVTLASSQNPELRSFHLLTTTLYKFILKLNELLDINDQKFILIQSLNIILGLGCAILLYQSLLRLGIDQILSVLISTLFAVSNGIWIHTINAETGIHPQFFFMLSLYFLIRFILTSANKIVLFILSLISMSLSVLFALNLALLLPLFFLILLYESKNCPEISRPKLWISSCIILTLLILIPFLAFAYSRGVRSIPQFFNWITFHPESQRLTHIQMIGIESILRSVAGLISALIQTGSGLTLVKLTIRKEIIHGTTLDTFLQLGLGLVILLFIIFFSLRGILTRTNRLIVWLCFLGLLIIFFSNIFWLGSDPQFWLPGLPLLLILTAMGFRIDILTYLQKIAGYLFLITLIINMIWINIPRDLPSLISPEGGKELKNAKIFASNFKQGGLIFTPGYSWGSYLKIIRKDLNLIHLVYDQGLGRDEEFYQNIEKMIQNSLNSKSDIYLDGLEGPKFINQYGAWQMFQSYRGVSREEFYNFIIKRYNLRVLINSQDGIISHLTSQVKNSIHSPKKVKRTSIKL